MLQLLRQRRWLGFTVFAVLVVVLCGFLANWQWHRYQTRQRENAQLDAALAAAPAPVDTLLAATGEPLPAALQWRAVTARGTFDVAHQVAVRRRPLDGTNGFWIVTPLVTANGTLLVNRGWTAADGKDARATPQVDPPPAGEVTVTGRLRPAEPPHDGEIPPGQAWSVDPGQLVPPGSEPRYNAYVEMIASEPAAGGGLTDLPVPGHKGTNNLVYTGQWIIFGLVGMFGWWRLMASETQRAQIADTREQVGEQGP